MTLFYQGTLQDGISLAMRETKAVLCFAEDTELSATWEEEYFAGDEVAQLLSSKAVSLRLSAGSQEAGFLTSFCPIQKFPTVVIIKNGTLQEYLGPDISKEDFRSRLTAALASQTTPVPAQQSQSSRPSQSNNAAAAPAAATPVAPAQPPASHTSSPRTQSTRAQSSNKPRPEASASNKEPPKKVSTPSTSSKSATPKRPPQEQKQKATPKPETNDDPSQKHIKPTASKIAEQPEPQPRAPRPPPSQYRLQVRLFDGSSVRSSFKPSQTIRNDVRPWLDPQMADDNRPYNLKHILTPLPSRTISVSEESQTLEELGIGPTANLVMVPVATYTDAYAAAGSSLPVRGVSAVYNVVSSAAGIASGLVGSFFGYAATAPENNEAESPGPSSSAPPPPSTQTSQRPRTTGPTIRTLRDQQDERGNSQFYNGNQLNFEPRKNQDGKDK
ncbi:hypothetical protein N7474_005394 [Penicillium riverlandense]|uniref:uncharacterized protein n=1 Tax=Penicillium riverlandense TaxID=1903569 RepID=UPI0025495587|nr:uncharacterized protein N7474_005394 [Penicillium riverlandense]KAJ5819803.1 hypothetical protein N7474_005394 [Penicillium riverlandense]